MVAPLVVVAIALGSMFRGLISAASTTQQVVTLDLGPFVRWIPVSGVFTGAAAAMACAIVLGIERAQSRLVPTIAVPTRPDAVVLGLGRPPGPGPARPIGRSGHEVLPRGLGTAVIVLLAAQFVLADLGVAAFLAHLALYRASKPATRCWGGTSGMRTTPWPRSPVSGPSCSSSRWSCGASGSTTRNGRSSG
jgi:hypothetical protein